MSVRFSLRAALAAGAASPAIGAVLVGVPAAAAPPGGDSHAAKAPDRATPVSKVGVSTPKAAQSDPARAGVGRTVDYAKFADAYGADDPTEHKLRKLD